MSTRTKVLWVIFGAVTLILCVLVSTFNWNGWVLAAPVIILEITSFGSMFYDESQKTR